MLIRPARAREDGAPPGGSKRARPGPAPAPTSYASEEIRRRLDGVGFRYVETVGRLDRSLFLDYEGEGSPGRGLAIGRIDRVTAEDGRIPLTVFPSYASRTDSGLQTALKLKRDVERDEFLRTRVAPTTRVGRLGARGGGRIYKFDDASSELETAPEGPLGDAFRSMRIGYVESTRDLTDAELQDAGTAAAGGFVVVARLDADRGDWDEIPLELHEVAGRRRARGEDVGALRERIVGELTAMPGGGRMAESIRLASYRSADGTVTPL